MLQSGGLKPKAVLSNADAPDHTRTRKHAWQAFTPKRVAELEPDIRRLVTRYMANATGLLEYWKAAENYIQSLLAYPPDNYVGDLIRVS